MTTSSEVNSGQERRWDRGSWLALTFALFLFVYIGIQAGRVIRVPQDGWNIQNNMRAAAPEIIFLSQTIGPASPLQPGDKLISVEGESVAVMVGRHFVWKLLPAPDWPDDTRLEYVVERDGETVVLAVPVYRYGFGERLITELRVRGLPGVLQVAGSVFFFGVGVIVFLLRPRQRAAHALLILGVAFLFNAAPTSQGPTSFFYPFRPPSVPFDTWIMGINPSLMLLALAFPAAKLPIRRYPRLTTLFLYLWAPLAISTAYLLNLGNAPGYFSAAAVVYVVQILMLFVLVFGSLIHSAFKIREPVARSQLKWVGLGLASFVVPGVGGWLLGFLGFQTPIIYFLTVAGWFIMPICLAIAITRYRLFDIDIIIRRTLQYSILTGLLALVYFGGVVLFQAIFHTASGETSSPAVVLSTLIIAALFTPLRRRVQTLIDRRFHRQKYDAQQVLAQFAQTARDEVEMERLAAAVQRTIADTMQPETVSIWLKPISKNQP
jgi:hypothetical protein